MKVGDYVRTKKGEIGKLYYTGFVADDETPYYINFKKGKVWIKEGNIIKSSPNIIDLIEVGDYVNGYRVCEIIEKNQLGYYESSKGTRGKKAKEKSFCLDNNYTIKYTNREIESLITKEQFESIQYNLESEVN